MKQPSYIAWTTTSFNFSREFNKTNHYNYLYRPWIGASSLLVKLRIWRATRTNVPFPEATTRRWIRWWRLTWPLRSCKLVVYRKVSVFFKEIVRVEFDSFILFTCTGDLKLSTHPRMVNCNIFWQIFVGSTCTLLMVWLETWFDFSYFFCFRWNLVQTLGRLIRRFLINSFCSTWSRGGENDFFLFFHGLTTLKRCFYQF